VCVFYYKLLIIKLSNGRYIKIDIAKQNKLDTRSNSSRMTSLWCVVTHACIKLLHMVFVLPSLSDSHVYFYTYIKSFSWVLVYIASNCALYLTSTFEKPYVYKTRLKLHPLLKACIFCFSNV